MLNVCLVLEVFKWKFQKNNDEMKASDSPSTQCKVQLHFFIPTYVVIFESSGVPVGMGGMLESWIFFSEQTVAFWFCYIRYCVITVEKCKKIVLLFSSLKMWQLCLSKTVDWPVCSFLPLLCIKIKQPISNGLVLAPAINSWWHCKRHAAICVSHW